MVAVADPAVIPDTVRLYVVAAVTAPGLVTIITEPFDDVAEMFVMLLVYDGLLPVSVRVNVIVAVDPTLTDTGDEAVIVTVWLMTVTVHVSV